MRALSHYITLQWWPTRLRTLSQEVVMQKPHFTICASQTILALRSYFVVLHYMDLVPLRWHMIRLEAQFRSFFIQAFRCIAQESCTQDQLYHVNFWDADSLLLTWQLFNYSTQLFGNMICTVWMYKALYKAFYREHVSFRQDPSQEAT